MPSSSQRNVHIVVAAGSGSRFGSDLPKQFCPLSDGKPLLMCTLNRLAHITPGWQIVVVLSRDMEETWREMCTRHGFDIPHSIAYGGATRAESVKSALESLDRPETIKYISVHDAARPVVTRRLVCDLLMLLTDESVDGCVPATHISDTIRMADGSGKWVPVDRRNFIAVQTPQIFQATKLLEAYRHPLMPTHTDDASVMESAGFHNIQMHEADPRNIKVTNPGDLEVVELYLKQCPI